MTYQSTVRNQRSKGFKVKQALQFALILAICIWLLYQFKHSRDKKKDYGGSILSKLSEEHGSVILGRKGIAGWLSDGVESNLEEVNLTAEGENKEDGGGGDDELDRNAEEKAEEGSFHEENEYSHGNVATQEEKDEEKEPETQFKESVSNEDNNSGIEVKEGDDALGSNKDIPEEEYSSKGHENSKGSVSDHDDQGDENDPEIQVSHDEQGDEKDPETQVSHNKQGDEDPETQVKESQNNEDITNTQIEDKDEAVGSYKENDEDKETTKSEEKIVRQPSGIENATDLDQSKLEGIHGFRDENGFPQDGMDLLESTPTVSSDDEANILRQETISSLNNQSRITEIMPVEGEKNAFKKGSNTDDVETESKSTLEDSKNDTTADAEINSETSVHIDTSSMNHASETTQESNIVSEDSHSVSSHQEQEERLQI